MRFILFSVLFVGPSFGAMADIHLTPGTSARVGGQTITCSGEISQVVTSCDCRPLPRTDGEETPFYAIDRVKTSIQGQLLAIQRVNRESHFDSTRCELAILDIPSCPF